MIKSRVVGRPGRQLATRIQKGIKVAGSLPSDGVLGYSSTSGTRVGAIPAEVFQGVAGWEQLDKKSRDATVRTYKLEREEANWANATN